MVKSRGKGNSRRIGQWAVLLQTWHQAVTGYDLREMEMLESTRQNGVGAVRSESHRATSLCAANLSSVSWFETIKWAFINGLSFEYTFNTVIVIFQTKKPFQDVWHWFISSDTFPSYSLILFILRFILLNSFHKFEALFQDGIKEKSVTLKCLWSYCPAGDFANVFFKL